MDKRSCASLGLIETVVYDGGRYRSVAAISGSTQSQVGLDCYLSGSRRPPRVTCYPAGSIR